MTKATGLWSKIKKTIGNEVQDDERLAANLDLARGLRGSLRGSYIVKAGSELISDMKNAIVRFRNDTVERLTEKRLLRSAALFVGSVLVMRNFGELMAV